MQKRIMQAASTIVLFATLATPAFAHGNGGGKSKDKHENRGNHFGWFKNWRSDDDDLPRGWEKAKEKWERRDGQQGNSVCVITATTTNKSALTAAQTAKETAMIAARAALRTATVNADAAKSTAMDTARAAWRASSKDASAQTAFVNAWIKAKTDWRNATNAAQTTFGNAQTAAEGTFMAAKLKAESDLKAAKTACGPDTTPTPTPTPTPTTGDTVAPGAVSNLSPSGATATTVLLSWNATGDDGVSGTAASYDVRYSTSVITAANFASATQATGEPIPTVNGSAQSMTVSGLSSGTQYFFAIRVIDDASNVSAVSNVPTATTLALGDVTAPAAVDDLSLSGVTSSSMILSWIAPGDDHNVGTANSYDARYSTSAITAANFASASAVTGEPIPTIAGSGQSVTVSGLSAGTVYFFAIRATDEAGNVAALSNVPSLQTAP